MPVLFANTFIGLLSFPRMTVATLTLFLVLRLWHMQSYLSFRGHNKAFAAEEFSKLTVVMMVAIGLASSLNIMGLWRVPAVMWKVVPMRFRKVAASGKV